MVTVTAANSEGTAIEAIALTVNSGLAITSAGSASGDRGQGVQLHGHHASAPRRRPLPKPGRCPPGLRFVANANGTATLSGTPARDRRRRRTR